MSPYITQKELDANKQLFRSCECCSREGFRHDELAEYQGKEICDECYLMTKQEEIGKVELQLDRDHGWTCIRVDRGYEPGDIIGIGDTIPKAIEDWLEQMEEKHSLDRKHIHYTWKGEETPQWWIEFAKRKSISVLQ